MAEKTRKTGIRKAGDVTIQNCTITTVQGQTVNILPQITNIEIYEDMFAPFITGVMTIEDAQDLIGLAPIVGEEKISLELTTPSMEKTGRWQHVFFLTKLTEYKKRRRKASYKLHFISREGINDLNAKISRAYEGNCADLVERVVQSNNGLESGKQVRIEETNSKVKFISNFWSPTRILQYICEHSVNTNDSPTYLFFESRRGFNFVSLDYLKNRAPDFKFEVADSKNNNSPPLNQKQMQKDFEEVIQYNPKTPFNYFDRVRGGMLGAETIYYDMLTQQYTHNKYIPTADTKRLNEFPMFSTDRIAHTKASLLYGHQYYNNFEGWDITSNSKILAERASLLAEIESHKCMIQVKGRTDYTCGDKVYLRVPKNKQIKEDTDVVWDGIQSGYYLIGAIKHIIGPETHDCVLELIKDSYMVDLNERAS